MTKRLLAATVLLLLLVPVASAHRAPDPRTFETRLMHDCVDDGGHAVAAGYDLHALDIWEFWDGVAQQVGFRLILNGGGGVTITVGFDVDGSAKQYVWSNDGDEWTGSGWDRMEVREDVYVDGSDEAVEDGDRFALIGVVSKASLGGDGTVLEDFTVDSDASIGDDSMPGNDGPGACEENTAAFERPDYTLGEKSVETGYLSKVPDDGEVGLLADEEHFVNVTMANRITTLKQQVTMRIVNATGNATARFHVPGGDYADTDTDTDTVDVELDRRIGPDGATNPASETLIHLVLNAPEGSSGTVTIALTTHVVLKDGTTQPGGHLVRTFDYTVKQEGDATQPTPETTPNGDDNTIPAPSVVLASVVLLAGALWRRR